MGYAELDLLFSTLLALLLAAAILIPLPSRSRAKAIEQMGQSSMGVVPICDSVSRTGKGRMMWQFTIEIRSSTLRDGQTIYMVDETNEDGFSSIVMGYCTTPADIIEKRIRDNIEDFIAKMTSPGDVNEDEG